MKQNKNDLNILIVGPTTHASVACSLAIFKRQETASIQYVDNVFDAIEKAAKAKEEGSAFNCAFVDSRLPFLKEYLPVVDVERKKCFSFEVKERIGRKIVGNIFRKIRKTTTSNLCSKKRRHHA